MIPQLSASPAATELSARFTPWQIRLLTFLQNHPDWDKFLTSDEAVYRLPDEIINDLTLVPGGHRTRKAILTSAQGQAEREFTAICSAYGPQTIGDIPVATCSQIKKNQSVAGPIGGLLIVVE